MQFPISDQGAIDFSRGLYRRLANGDPLDTAVAEARMTLHAVRPRSLEWATPVLLMRSPDGRLFELPDAHDFALGMRHFWRGEQRLAAEHLRRARSANPLHGEADLFYCLALLSERAPDALTLAEADRIDGILSRVIDDRDERTESLARLALGLVRHDFYFCKRLRPRGIPSDALFRRLAGYRPTPEEERALQSIRYSNAAALACGLALKGR